ncbi:hypothetical protein L3X38_037652 [Prunus dulcis]|uniref:Uncharacterized protein n=1 Tax=Prunus dulcis TaxID=3755 RepID=A0AAD4V3R8_PRUDU|nr:hypothetical protein L3X38_037652 [Prunus dulcis]
MSLHFFGTSLVVRQGGQDGLRMGLGQARHECAEGEGDVEGTKLACCKAMWLGTGCRKQRGCQRRHKACMSQMGCRKWHKAYILQDDVARHGGAAGKWDAEGGTKLACCKMMWPGKRVLKANGILGHRKIETLQSD